MSRLEQAALRRRSRLPDQVTSDNAASKKITCKAFDISGTCAYSSQCLANPSPFT